LQRKLGRGVVPVFWNATDDEDFEEIASVGWPAADGTLGFLELPRAARRAGGWVGDLPAAGDEAAAAAARAGLDAERAAHLDPFLPAGAADHGTWVALWLGRLFPELAILDARAAALRVHAAELFARYLEGREAAAAAVESSAAELVTAGYTRTLDTGAARNALYVTRARRREKSADDVEPLRRLVAQSPADVSPNVTLRPLVQDTLLPTVAQVVGPSEVGYLMELRGLRRMLGVPEPALVPRLTCTVLPHQTWQEAHELGATALQILTDPEAALRVVAAPEARAAFDAGLETVRESLTALPLEAAAAARAARRLESLRSEVAADLDAAARAALRARSPRLAALPSLVRPRGRAQERILAALWVVAARGAACGEELVSLADAHLDALGQGKPEHALVTLE
jgi:hypothetical protein